MMERQRGLAAGLTLSFYLQAFGKKKVSLKTVNRIKISVS